MSCGKDQMSLKVNISGYEQDVFIISDGLSWTNPSSLSKNGSENEISLLLPTGVYRYRLFYKDKDNKSTYFLDQNNLRTISEEGEQSNIFVINGSEEPVIHAPGLPMVWKDKSGLIHIKALLRKGFNNELTLCWLDMLEGYYNKDSMRLVGEDDQHLLFEFVIPDSEQPIRYYFTTSQKDYSYTRGLNGPYFQNFTIWPKKLDYQIPQWWGQSIVYKLIRFEKNSDIINICDKIKEISESGFNVILIDQKFYSHEELKKIVDEAHKNKLKLVINLSLIDSMGKGGAQLAVIKQIVQSGADGIMLDDFSDIEDGFLEQINQLVKNTSAEMVILGNIIPDRSFRYLKWLDSRTNYFLNN